MGTQPAPCAVLSPRDTGQVHEAGGGSFSQVTELLNIPSVDTQQLSELLLLKLPPKCSRTAASG